MRFAVITHVPHTISHGRLSAYGPYVREMNIWGSRADVMEIVAPLLPGSAGAIDLAYDHPEMVFTEIKSFDMLSTASKIKAIKRIPGIAASIFKAMRRADHIHLRCPGNIGLLGCVLQIFFPSKRKTAKYAGNWDPDSKQPLTYRIQKWILNNTLLTRNMQVLVYGHWRGAGKNIKPFFTATYKESDKTPLPDKDMTSPMQLLFVGTLSPGKQPLYAVRLADKLHGMGCNVVLDLYGEGSEREKLENYIREQKLGSFVHLRGNHDEYSVRQAYKRAHFVLLPSRSEGWPKVVAEAMFWGSLPAATPVSCVDYMLDGGKRGIILQQDLAADCAQLMGIFSDNKRYREMAQSAAKWSRAYTLDAFSQRIKEIINEKA